MVDLDCWCVTFREIIFDLNHRNCGDSGIVEGLSVSSGTPKYSFLSFWSFRNILKLSYFWLHYFKLLFFSIFLSSVR